MEEEKLRSKVKNKRKTQKNLKMKKKKIQEEPIIQKGKNQKFLIKKIKSTI